MAVYTNITYTDLHKFLNDFSIGKLVSFKGITSGVENTNYFVTTTQATFVLTIFEKRTNTADLPFFLDLMNHLSDKGISCPQVLKNKDGKTLQTIVGKTSVLISFLKGGEITPTESACEQVGATLAKMHLAVEDFTQVRKNTLALDGWQELYNSEKQHMSAELKSTLADELAYQHANKNDHLKTGIVHADLFTDNVFFDDGKLSGVIDFYFSCTDSYTYDLAITITAWCFGDDFDTINVGYVTAMMLGYQSVRPLDTDEKKSFTTLARGACVRFLLTRFHDEIHTPNDASVSVKDHTEYLRKLKFYQSFNFEALEIFSV